MNILLQHLPPLTTITAAKILAPTLAAAYAVVIVRDHA